jgi:hypothetical protein
MSPVVPLVLTPACATMAAVGATAGLSAVVVAVSRALKATHPPIAPMIAAVVTADLRFVAMRWRRSVSFSF